MWPFKKEIKVETKIEELECIKNIINTEDEKYRRIFEIYNKDIRAKYSGKDFYWAFPRVIIEVIDAYEELKNQDKSNKGEETMPSKSQKQHNLFEAAANGAKFPMAKKIPTKVAKEFTSADKGKKFGKGGKVPKPKMSKRPQGR